MTYSGVWGCEGGYECCHDEPREAELVCPREGMLQVGREVSCPAALPILCQERRQSWPVVKMFSWVLGLVHFGSGGVWGFFGWFSGFCVGGFVLVWVCCFFFFLRGWLFYVQKTPTNHFS